MTPGCQRPTVETERGDVYQPRAQRLPSHKGAISEPAHERGAPTTPTSSAPTGNFPMAQVSRGGLSGKEREGEGRRPAQNFTTMLKTVSCSRTRKQTAMTEERHEQARGHQSPLENSDAVTASVSTETAWRIHIGLFSKKEKGQKKRFLRCWC